jgi:replication factor A2
MDFQGGDGGGGGGYTTGNNNFGSPEASQGGQKSRRSYDEQTLIPVSIQMALKSHPDPSGGDGSLVLDDGRKVASVKIVGAVRQVNDNSTNVMYELEDGTGLMEVKQWLDDNDCTALQELRQATLQEHVYLKVIGQIKDYEGKKLLVANSVRLLSTGNELTHHFLEVVHSVETHKRADSIVSAPMSTNSGVGFGGSLQQPMAQTTGGGDTLKDQVLNYIRTEDDGSETGVNITECIKAMTSTPESEIRRAIEALSEEGHIYSTISEDNYKFAV